MMAGETVITVIGNLTNDPELRFTQSGAAVADFTVASSPRTFDRNTGQWVQQDGLFLRCTCWRDMADNVAESLRKGMRVIVQGRLTQRSYETREGDRRTVVELQVDEVGPSLRRAQAKVTRNPAPASPNGGPQATPYGNGPAASYVSDGHGAGSQDDPWQARTPGQGGVDDAPPF